MNRSLNISLSTLRSSRTRHADDTFIDVDDLDELVDNNVDDADSVNVDHEDLVYDSSADPLACTNELRTEKDARRKRRRGQATAQRYRSSIWTTLGVLGVDVKNKSACAICGIKIAISRMSSSNIVSHYQSRHQKIAMKVTSSESLAAKKAVLELAVHQSRNTQA